MVCTLQSFLTSTSDLVCRRSQKNSSNHTRRPSPSSTRAVEQSVLFSIYIPFLHPWTDTRYNNLDASVLGDLLRACSQNPSQKQVMELNNQKQYSWDQFLTILKRPGGFDAPGTFDEFMQAFKVLDQEMNGYISTGQLRHSKNCIGQSCERSVSWRRYLQSAR